jgi:hypothetical protein
MRPMQCARGSVCSRRIDCFARRRSAHVVNALAITPTRRPCARTRSHSTCFPKPARTHALSCARVHPLANACAPARVQHPRPYPHPRSVPLRGRPEQLRHRGCGAAVCCAVPCCPRGRAGKRGGHVGTAILHGGGLAGVPADDAQVWRGATGPPPPSASPPLCAVRRAVMGSSRWQRVRLCSCREPICVLSCAGVRLAASMRSTWGVVSA